MKVAIMVYRLHLVDCRDYLLKIAAVHNNNNGNVFTDKKHSNVKFGSISSAILNGSGTLMSTIDNQGYVLSFLIQDGLGMTFPRVVTGFFRDKETTGHYNPKEALEVFLREAITGPYMMAVAPAMLFLAGKFCKSTNTNTRLIKIMGENLKSMIKDPAFDKNIMKNSQDFKNKF